MSVLLACKITVYADSVYRELLGDGIEYFESGCLPRDAELIIVLGGDATWAVPAIEAADFGNIPSAVHRLLPPEALFPLPGGG